MKTSHFLLKITIIVAIVILLFVQKPVYSNDNLTFNDAKSVINTLLMEYYKPLGAKTLTGAFLLELKEKLKNMGIEQGFEGIDVTGKIDDDIHRLEEVVEKIHLSPLAKSEIIFCALKNMFDSLDDEGTKIEAPEKRYKSLKELGYERGGAGFFVDEEKDKMGCFTVIETLPGFLSEKYGIKTGDRILMVDAIPLKDLSYSQLADLIRGPIGSDVTITFVSSNNNKIKTVTIQRRWLAPNYKTIIAEPMNNDILYMRIKYLGENMDDEFSRVLDDYKKKGIRKIVLDLRNNGGNIKGAREFAEYFIEGNMILYTIVTREGREVFYSRTHKTSNYPMVILLNKYSGSPSVLFAGILQDYGKALIVGAESRWSENVDKYYALPNGSIFRVTNGYYELPKGRILLPKKGIRSDREVSQDPLTKYPPSQDSQLQNAIDILK